MKGNLALPLLLLVLYHSTTTIVAEETPTKSDNASEGNDHIANYEDVGGAGIDYHNRHIKEQKEKEKHDGIDATILDTSIDVGRPSREELAHSVKYAAEHVKANTNERDEGEAPPVPTNSASESHAVSSMTSHAEEGAGSGDPAVNEVFGVSVDPGLRVDMGSIWPHWSQMAALSSGEGYRRYTRDIRFTVDFMNTPIVQVGVRAVNIFPAYDQRINVYASEVTSRGFRLTIETWGNSKVITAGASWTAYGQDTKAYKTHIKEMKLKVWLGSQLPLRAKETEKMMKKVAAFRKYMKAMYAAIDKKLAKMVKMREKLEANYRKSQNFKNGVIPQIKATLVNMQSMRVMLERKMREVWAREYAKLVKMRSTIKTLKANNANLRMRVKQMKAHHQKLFTQVSYEFKELWHYQHVSAAILDNMETLKAKVGETVQSTRNAHPNVSCHCHKKDGDINGDTNGTMEPGKVCICQSNKPGETASLSNGGAANGDASASALGILQSP